MQFQSVQENSDYLVNETGEIYSLKSKRFLKASPNKNIEYLQVSLWKDNIGKSFYVHRIVANAFIPNPDKLPEVNHKDGNRQNNHKDNLEWVTSSGNSYHAVTSGLRTYTNRLTKDQLEECLDCVINGETYLALSRRVPYKVPFLSTKLRQIAKSIGREEELNIALKEQRAARNRKVLEVVNQRRFND